MARVTVEDCLKHVDNRFDLVLKAAERAHKLELGAADPTVSPDNDKPTVIALREIAAGNDITQLRVRKEPTEAEEKSTEMVVSSESESSKVESTPRAAPDVVIKEEDTH